MSFEISGSQPLLVSDVEYSDSEKGYEIVIRDAMYIGLINSAHQRFCFCFGDKNFGRAAPTIEQTTLFNLC